MTGCVCMCVCVVQYAVAARFLFGWLTAWPRGEFADLFAGKNTTVAFVLLFSPFVLYFFFFTPSARRVCFSSILSPSLHHLSLPLLIHKNTSHRWMASIGTGAWFDPTAHTHFTMFIHTAACCAPHIPRSRRLSFSSRQLSSSAAGQWRPDPFVFCYVEVVGATTRLRHRRT